MPPAIAQVPYILSEQILSPGIFLSSSRVCSCVFEGIVRAAGSFSTFKEPLHNFINETIWGQEKVEENLVRLFHGRNWTLKYTFAVPVSQA